MNFLSVVEQKRKCVSFQFILCIVYVYLRFDFESKKLNTRWIGIREHLAVLLSLGVSVYNMREEQ